MASIENGDVYYKYMLVYTYDVLHLLMDTQEDMLKLNHVYWLKESFGPPYRFIGANVDKFQLEDVRTVLDMTCVEYMCRSTKNVDSILEVNKEALKSFGDGHHTYP